MSGEWTNHPRLKGRFHKECPDDLQVIIHDGHPAITNRSAELVWVRVTACAREVSIFAGRRLPLFRGILLNKPRHLETVSEGNELQFLMPEGGEYPLQVTEKYLEERDS